MLYWLQKKFGFSKKELRGITVLLLLIVITWVTPMIYEACHKPAPLYFERVKAAERALTLPSGTEKPASSVVYSPFDPNNLSVTEWRKLGLLPRQIKNIKNFEAKGGRFRKKEDLLKLYTISANDYKRLEPFIQIKEAQKKEVVSVQRDSIAAQRYQAPITQLSKTFAHVELNTADSTSLLALPGIGPVFASRIVRYRNLLGGFYAIEQLKEVYGMDSLRYQQVAPLLYVEDEKKTRIALNTADFELLRRHPYIKDKYARLIVQYRKQHGAFKKIEDLLEIVLIDPEYLRKIAPYLMIDHD